MNPAFAILLGDNIYDDGVHSIDDPQWEEKFEGPYRNIDMPFYPVLGNHEQDAQIEGQAREFSDRAGHARLAVLLAGSIGERTGVTSRRRFARGRSP